MIATDNEDMVLVSLLLKFGADINAQDNEGMTALMRAVVKDSYILTGQLLEKKAKTNLKDKQGRTALSIATRLDGMVLMMYQKELSN